MVLVGVELRLIVSRRRRRRSTKQKDYLAIGFGLIAIIIISIERIL